MRVRSIFAYTAVLAVGSLATGKSAYAADFDVTDQTEFAAAIAAATQPGRNDTINVNAQTISSGPSLMLPAAATAITINFNGVPGPANNNPTFDVSGPGAGNVLDIGPNTLLNFNISNGTARLRVGIDDGTGIVNMTGGTIVSSGTQGGSSYLTVDVGRGNGGATGVFNQSGGQVLLGGEPGGSAGGALQIGYEGATGTYTMTNDALVDMGYGTVYIGDGVGAEGTLHISGNAQFLLNQNGSPSGQIYVGNGEGKGTIIQDGPGSLVILNSPNGINLGAATATASSVGGVGEYYMSAGELRIGGGTTGNVGLNLGRVAGGTGNFFQSGGLVTLNQGQIRFGPGTSTYELTGGTLQIGVANPFAVNPSGTYNFTLGSGTIRALTDFTSSIDMDGYELMQSTFDTNGHQITLNGRLYGLGSVKFTGGGIAVLNGANSHDAPTALDGVTVVVGHNTALGNSFTDFISDSTLQFGGSHTLANNMFIAAGVLATMDTDGNTGTLGGVISGGGALKKDGAGTLVLDGANTYTGGTWIADGILQLGASGSLASTGRVQVDSGATFDLNDHTQTIGSLSGAGTVDVGIGMLTAGGDNSSTAFSGTVDMTNQGYQSPYGRFAKVGTGTLTIDNATFELGETYILQGKMAQTSGDTSVSYLAVGTGTTSGSPNVGGLDVTGGTITFGTALQVGDWGGIGTVNQTGGTVQLTPECGDIARCSSMNIGNQGGTGVYNISGGVLNLTGWLNTLGRSTGTNPGSSGTLNISGDAVVDLSNDGINPSRLIVGFGNSNAAQAQSQGTINQTGGILRVHDGSTLNIGGQNTSSGIYNLYGGTLEIGGTGALLSGYGNANADYQFNFGTATIKVIEAAFTTSVDATLMAGTLSTIDTNGFGATWSGVMSGSGALAKAGAGTLVLNAANSYAGGTLISGGTLQLGASGSLAPTGALQVDAGATFDLNNHVQTIGAFAGAGSVLLGSGELTANTAISTLFSGVMSGAGDFVKQGSSTLVFTGTNIYSGLTTVAGGTLVVGVGGNAPSQIPTSSLKTAPPSWAREPSAGSKFCRVVRTRQATRSAGRPSTATTSTTRTPRCRLRSTVRARAIASTSMAAWT